MLSAIFALPLFLLLLLIFALLMGGEQLGRGICRLSTREGAAEPKDMGNVLTSVYALLGLLVAFTFGMAVDRYETRRELVIEEANAIGTAHIRSAFAAEPHSSELREWLEVYAEKRLAFGKADGAERQQIIEQSGEMRKIIARVAVNASNNVIATPMGPALIDSVNTVIDVGGERDATSQAFIPLTVAWLLIAYAFSAALLLGFSSAGRGRHIAFGNAILLFLLTMALTLIADLDRPAGGTIKISQHPMTQLIAGFE